MKENRPEFYALYKDFNDGKMKSYDVLKSIFNYILTSKNKLNKDFFNYDANWNKIPIKSKKDLMTFLNIKLRYHYWGKCEWEYIAIDWPHRDTIDNSRPVKIDVYEQLKPNLNVITDLVWNYIKDKIENSDEQKTI